MHNNTIVLLHGFYKKIAKMPAKKLDLAKKRKQLGASR